MRHLKRTAKLGRTGEHRNAMLANLVCSLIKHKRVTTTLAKAKAARSVAEKLVTLGKKDTIHARRLVAARLHQEDATKILFAEIAPAQKDRNGGYTRIVKRWHAATPGRRRAAWPSLNGWTWSRCRNAGRGKAGCRSQADRRRRRKKGHKKKGAKRKLKLPKRKPRPELV